MQKKSMYLEVDEQIQLILPAKSSSDEGISVSDMKKVRLMFYTVPYSFYCKRVSVCFLYFFSVKSEAGARRCSVKKVFLEI